MNKSKSTIAFKIKFSKLKKARFFIKLDGNLVIELNKIRTTILHGCKRALKWFLLVAAGFSIDKQKGARGACSTALSLLANL
jgi:hypothetical protein